jgi:hypothetical protein
VTKPHRKLGTAEIEAGGGLRDGIRQLNATRPDLLAMDIVHMEIVGTGIGRRLIVVYWYTDE